MQARRAPGLMVERCREEIERAISNAKRSELDKWWRRQWYRETARMARVNGWGKKRGG